MTAYTDNQRVEIEQWAERKAILITQSSLSVDYIKTLLLLAHEKGELAGMERATKVIGKIVVKDEAS